MGAGWGTLVCGTDPPVHATNKTEPQPGEAPSLGSGAGQCSPTPAGRGNSCWVARSAGRRWAQGRAG